MITHYIGKIEEAKSKLKKIKIFILYNHNFFKSLTEKYMILL